MSFIAETDTVTAAKQGREAGFAVTETRVKSSDIFMTGDSPCSGRDDRMQEMTAA